MPQAPHPVPDLAGHFEQGEGTGRLDHQVAVATDVRFHGRQPRPEMHRPRLAFQRAAAHRLQIVDLDLHRRRGGLALQHLRRDGRAHTDVAEGEAHRAVDEPEGVEVALLDLQPHQAPAVARRGQLGAEHVADRVRELARHVELHRLRCFGLRHRLAALRRVVPAAEDASRGGAGVFAVGHRHHAVYQGVFDARGVLHQPPSAAGQVVHKRPLRWADRLGVEDRQVRRVAFEDLAPVDNAALLRLHRG